MGVLEILIALFLVLFVLGLVLSLTIWLIWLSLILAVIFTAVRLVRQFFKALRKHK